MNTVDTILKEKIIVIVRGVARDDLIELAEAAYAGGIRLLECTYDASGKIPDEETAKNIELLAEHFDGRMQIGAGTVINSKQVGLTARAGGKFIISPDTYEGVIDLTKDLGLVSIPGALTPTEITRASRLGADFVKVFPVDMFGPKYIKTLKAPLSNVNLLAVNGITADNMCDYLAAGAAGVGIGSGIVNKELIAKKEFAAITALAKKYTDKIL